MVNLKIENSSTIFINLHRLNGYWMNKIMFGFKQSPQQKKGHLGEKWNFTSEGALLSAPVVEDIDHDGRKEILFGTRDGKIYLLDLNGKVKWKYSITESMNDVDLMFLDSEEMHSINATPNIGDINNDGKHEIVFGSELGFIYALSNEGTLLWKFKTDGPIRASALIEDLNNDGHKEIIFGSTDNHLYILTSAGKLIMKLKVNSGIESCPAVIKKTTQQIVFGSNDGTLYSIDFNGKLLWRFKTEGKISAQPVIAELFDDKTENIVVGSFDNYVYCLDTSGRLLWKFKTDGSICSKVAVGDINNDGKLELVFGSCDNKIYAIKFDGEKIWDYETNFWVTISPIITDMDGDGTPEIIAGSYDHNIYILDSEGSYILDYVPGISGAFNQAGNYAEVPTQEPGRVHGKKIWQYQTDGIIVGCAYIPETNEIVINNKIGKVKSITHKKD
jgi:hypothetical protein